MKLREIRDILTAEVITGDADLEKEIKYGFAADLLSDVLALGRGSGALTLLITGIIHPQVIYASNIFDLGAIIFVRGKRPNEATLQLAIENQIPLLATPYIMFETCGLLYQHGLRPSIAKVKNG
jgi:predicted transcriptional regulator